LGRTRLADAPFFTGARNYDTEGLLMINKKGSVFSVNVDENKLVSHIMSSPTIMNGQDLGFTLA
jgi:hypothetical protein